MFFCPSHLWGHIYLGKSLNALQRRTPVAQGPRKGPAGLLACCLLDAQAAIRIAHVTGAGPQVTPSDGKGGKAIHCIGGLRLTLLVVLEMSTHHMAYQESPSLQNAH